MFGIVCDSGVYISHFNKTSKWNEKHNTEHHYHHRGIRFVFVRGMCIYEYTPIDNVMQW